MLTELSRIRREHHLTSAQLAEAAGIPLRFVYLAEIGGLIAEEEAHQILKALSRLTGKIYTLETIDLNITERNSYETPPSQPSTHHPTQSRRLAEH